MSETYDDVLTSGWQKDPDAKRDENPWQLDDNEANAKEQGSVEYASGIVRVSDSPNLIEPNPTEQKTSKSLYERTLGVTKYDELRSRVGLQEGQSFTDYYNGQGYVPEGYEMDAKLLLAEEKRKGLFAEYQSGNMGYSTFLYKAYGKDLMKAQGHDLSSSLYWYNRYRQGEYGNITDNAAFMGSVIEQAEQLFQADTWWQESTNMMVSDLAASYVTGERLDATKVRDIFEAQFDELDKYYESTEEIVKLYRAGYLRDFNPTIDIDEDGKVDYYYHTDGKLYAVAGSSGQGSNIAHAHYNDDGSLNRITLTGSGVGEITQSFLKGFTGMFTGVISFGGMLGGGIVDLVQGLTGNGWDFSAAVDASVALEEWYNRDTFLFGSNEFVVDSGFKTSDGDVNWMRIGKGVSSAAGTIAAMLVTAGLGGAAKGAGTASQVATAGAKTAAVASKAGKVAGALGKGAKAAGSGLLNLTKMLTGISNGAPLSWGGKLITENSMKMTAQAVAVMAVKDFLQTSVTLAANKEILDMTDGEIAGKAFGMSALNAGVSMIFRSTLDKAALTRWAEHAELKNKGAQMANALVKNGRFNSSFANAVNSWVTKSPKSFIAANTAMDIFENMFTAYTQTSLSQTGEIFSAEALKSFMSNPQTIAFNIWAGVSTAKGGLSKMDEGMETGNILRHVRNVDEMYTKVIADFKTTLMKSDDPQVRMNMEALINHAESTVQQAKDPLLGMTTFLIEAHNGLKDTITDSSPIKTVVMDTIGKNIKKEQLIEVQFAFQHFNAVRNATEQVAQETFRGKVGSYLHRRRNTIFSAYDATLKAMGLELEESVKLTRLGMSQYLVEAYAADGGISEATFKVMENLEIKSVVENLEYNDKTGKYEFKSGFDGLDAKELQVLQEANLTTEQLADGFFINLKGTGGVAEGTQDFKDLQAILRMMQRFVDLAAVENDSQQKLIYVLNDKHDKIFIPGNGVFTNTTLASVGRTIQLLYTIKYAQTPATKLEALKYLAVNLENDPNIKSVDDIKVDNLTTVLDLLQSENYFDLRAASTLLNALNTEHAKQDQDNNTKTQSPSKVLGLRNSPIVKFQEGMRIIDDINTIIKKETKTDTDYKKLNDLYKDYVRLDKDTKDKLLELGVVEPEPLKALEDWVVNGFPKTTQDLLNRLRKSLASALNSNEDLDIVEMLVKLIGPDQVVVPTPEERLVEISEMTGSKAVLDLVGSDEFELSNGEVRKINLATRQDFYDYFLKKGERPNVASRHANIASESMTRYKESYVLDRINTNNVSPEAFYRELYTRVTGKDGSLESLDNIKRAVFEENTSLDVIEYADAHFKNRNMVERMKDAVAFNNKLLKGTKVVAGDGIVYLNLDELTGKRLAQFYQRLQQPTVLDALGKAQTEADKVKIIFANIGNLAMAQVNKEVQALARMKVQYPTGVVSFDLNSPKDQKILGSLLKELDYDLVELRDNKNATIPGLYYKQENREDAALSFGLPKNKLDAILNQLRLDANKTKSSVASVETTEILRDHTDELHNLFGGLTTMRDDTELNPEFIPLNDYNANGSYNLDMLDYIYQLRDLNIKQGKLAGNLLEVAFQSKNGLGIATDRNPITRKYQLLIHAIDSIGKYVEDEASSGAVYALYLTTSEVNALKDSLWDLTPTESTLNNKRRYQVRSKFKTAEEFKAAAFKMLDTTNKRVNLNKILPVYGLSLEGGSVAFTTGDLGQQSLGYSPFTYITSVYSQSFIAKDFLDLFGNTRFENTHRMDDAAYDEALNLVRGKTVKEFLDGYASATAEQKTNIYYEMLYNIVAASKVLNDNIVASAIDGYERIQSVLGDRRLREIIGQELNALDYRRVNGEQLDLTAEYARIARLVTTEHAKNVPTTQGIKTRSDIPLYRQTDLDYKYTALTGAEAAYLNPRNTIQITGDDIKILAEINEARFIERATLQNPEANSAKKLLQMFQAANSEADGNLNIYVDALYKLDSNDREYLRRLLKGALSKSDYALLEEKFALLDNESDIYRTQDELLPIGSKLAVGESFERTISLALDTSGIVKKGDANDPVRKQLLEYMTNRLANTSAGKQEYKLSEIEALAGKNLEYDMMKKLAQLMGLEVLPGINREASIMIANMAMKENLGNFVQSIAALKQSLVDTEFFGNQRLNPEAAGRLALEMYLKSSNVDYQSEWTKYLLVDAKTGEVIDTAQRMAGAKEYNSLMRTITDLLDPEEKRDIIIFELDKNMMNANNAVPTQMLGFYELNETNRDKFVDIFIKNALEQWNNNPFFTNSNPDIVDPFDKISYVYRHTPSIKDRKEYFYDALINSGVDKLTAQQVSYDFYDLQSSKAENSKQTQILFNTWDLLENFDPEVARKVHAQMARMNDVMKYNITYESVPELIKQRLVEHAHADNMGYANFVNKLLNGTQEEGTLAYKQLMKNIQNTFDALEAKSVALGQRISAQASEEEVNKLIQEIINDSAYYYDLYKVSDKNTQEWIKQHHRENTYKLNQFGQLHKEISKMTSSLAGIMRKITSLPSLDVQSPEFKEALLKHAFKEYIFTSKRASAVSLALDNTDINYLLQFRNQLLPLRISVNGDPNVRDFDLSQKINSRKLSYDVENFYDDKGKGFIFQVGLYMERQDGTFSDPETIYVPVFDPKTGAPIRTFDDILAAGFGKILTDYQGSAGLRKALNGYIEFMKNYNPNTPIDLEARIASMLEGDDDYITIGFNNKSHDNALLIENGLLKPDSLLFTPGKNVDILNEVLSGIQTALPITNKKTLTAYLETAGIKSTEAHDGGEDARNTLTLLKSIVAKAHNLNETRQDGILDLEKIGRMITGDQNFKLEDHLAIFDDPDMKLNIDDLPQGAKDWIESYRDNFRNEDNLYRKTEAIDRYNYLLLQQESEINRKKQDDYIRTLPEEVRTLVSVMQNGEVHEKIRSLISYLALTQEPDSNKTYSSPYAKKYVDLDLSDPDQLKYILTDERTGLLDKVIDILNITYGKELPNKTLGSLSTIFTKDVDQILADIHKVFPHLTLEGYNKFVEEEKRTMHKPLVSAVNHHFYSGEDVAGYTKLNKLRQDEAYKTSTYRVMNTLAPIYDNVINTIESDYIKNYIREALATPYGRLNDNPIDKTRKVWKINSNVREALFDIIESNPIKKISKRGLYTMIQDVKVGSKISVNGVTEKVASDTIYTDVAGFKELIGVDYDVAKQHYAGDGDDLYITVLRHPGDKVAMPIFKIKVSETADLKTAMSPDTLRALLGGDVDGDGVVMIQPTKAMQPFAKSITPITRSAFYAWDKIEDILGGYKPILTKTKDNYGLIEFLQNGLTKLTRSNLADLSSGKLDYTKASEDATVKIKSLLAGAKITLSDDEIKTLLPLVWITRGPNVAEYVSNATNVPYFTYNLNLADDPNNLNARGLIKDMKNFIWGSNMVVDSGTGVIQKSYIQKPEFETVYNKAFNYAPFNLSSESLDRLHAIIEQNPDAINKIKVSLKDSLAADKFLSASSKKAFNKVIDQMADGNDVLWALRSYEDSVRNSKKAESTIIKAISQYQKDVKSEEAVNPNETYINALNALRSTQVDTSTDKFVSDPIDALDQAADLLTTILGDELSEVYFRDVRSGQNEISFLINQYRKTFPQLTEVKSKLADPNNQDGFIGTQQRTILYIKDEKFGDTIYKGPAANDMAYANFKKLRLSNDETLQLDVGDELIAGKALSTTQRVPEDLDGYTIARIIGNDVIVYKDLDINGQAKVGIAGTAITKATITPGEFDLSHFKKGFADDVSFISGYAGIDTTKIDTSVAKNLTTKYYNENQVEITDPKQFANAKYIKLTSPVALAAHTGTWKGNAKLTILDEIHINTNQRNLESIAMLDNNIIKVQDGQLIVDNSDIARLESIIKTMHQPDYISNNGAIVYKMMLLTKLVERSTIKDKETYLKTVLFQRNFAGAKGTSIIQSFINEHYKGSKFEAFKDSLTPMERVLFSDAVLNEVFKLETTKFPVDPKTKRVQESKRNEYKVIRNLENTIQGTPYKVKGQLGMDMNTSIVDGVRYESIPDTFISMVDLYNLLIREYNKETNQVLPYLSERDAQRATALGVFNETKMFKGMQTTNFNPTPIEYINRYDTDGSLMYNINPKMGFLTLPQQKSDSVGGNIRLAGNAPDYRESIDENITNNYLDSKNKVLHPERGYGEQTYRDRLAILLSSILADKSDAVTMTSRISPDYNTRLSFNPERLRLDLDPETNQYKVKSQPVTGFSNIDPSRFNEVMREAFASRDFYKQAASQKEDMDSILGRFIDRSMEYKTEEPTQSEDFSTPIKGKPQPSDAEQYYRDHIGNGLYVDVEEAVSNTRMPRDVTSGNPDNINKIYHSDLLSSTKIKVEDEASIVASQFAKDIRSEPTAIAREFQLDLVQVHRLASQYGIADDVVKYNYIALMYDRLKNIDLALKGSGLTEQERISYNQSKIEIRKLITLSDEEAKAFMVRFEKVYPDVVNAMARLNIKLMESARIYANINGEPSPFAYFLLPSEVQAGTEKEVHRYISSMYLNTKLDSIDKLPTLEGYNYFTSADALIKQISKQAAIANAGTRWKQKGYMDNKIIQDVVQETFEEYRESFMELGKENVYSKEIEQFNMLIEGLNYALDDNGFSDYKIIRLPSSAMKSLGTSYLEVYDDIQFRLTEIGISRQDAYKMYRSTKDVATKLRMESILNLYDFGNDIISILSSKQAKGNQGNTFLKTLYSRLANKYPDKVLVDSFGRKLDPDINGFRRLSPASFEFVDKILKYYSPYNGGFETNVALDALNGDVYYMSKSLANIVFDEFYTTKVPSKTQTFLKQVQAWAVRMLMSNPLKLPDRMAIYTGFDLGLLGMVNPEVYLKLGEARRDLSAYASSKGSVSNEQLNEYLYARGFDPQHTDVTQIYNDVQGFDKNGGFMQPYFDSVNRKFSYQTEFVRYAFWLATKARIEKGKSPLYGSAYHQKDYISSLDNIVGSDGEIKVTKAGNQAAYVMGHNIGAPGDFPILAKKLNGYAAFTTFPLALVRWGVGEAKSMSTAMKNLFVEGETSGAMKHLTVQGLGIAGIYMTSKLLYMLLADMFNIPEEEKEKWEEEQGVPKPFSTMVQGSPVMDTFSSINPLFELGEMTVNPFINGVKENQGDLNKGIGEGLAKWSLQNVVGRVNPAIKAGTEVVAGYDLIKDRLIPTRDKYNAFENLYRKTAGFILGSAGANNMVNYMKSYEDKDEPTIKRIGEGLQRAVSAELGNTKTYKSNLRNYYKANNLIQAYRYASKDTTDTDGDFNYDAYSKVKSEIQTAMNNKAKESEIYAIIAGALEEGIPIAEIRSAMKNNSLLYKLSTISDQDKFVASLTHAELETVRTALAYEDYMFPWLDDVQDKLDEAVGKRSSYYPRVYHNNYVPNYISSYNNYMRTNPYYKPYKPWEPDLIEETPLEAFKGKKEWKDWGNN